MPGLYLPFPFPHTQTASEVVTHISPPFVLLWPWTHFLTHLPTVLGRGRLESMLSAVPKGPGAASATGHLPPLPTADPGGGAQGQRGRGHGPCTSRRSSAPVPGRLLGLRPAAPRTADPPPCPRADGRQRRCGSTADGLRSPRAPVQSFVLLSPAPPSLPQPWAGEGEPGGGAGGAGTRAREWPVSLGEHNGRQSQNLLISMLMSAAAWR